ncbi:DUF72 domain-containing protein [Coriobacteriia bacterium Es71-Z0120]|uniref:DUF72 domain-containing protein n=1 Tax=Parvivirga hydrogeniphila TaxID=2939460 RepID=UPI002260A783|nr:DUF72 domain-containing protein [Parvivirga hydrogeniphila]MCL4078014.1 DUF72 domain-containing protein [Parvivirga hydrogeniphila]
MGSVRIGTCSWTDKTMVAAWYPPAVRTSEQRLRYYAARFDTVEADSPFYGIPRPSVAQAWAERTPPGFAFHVKAFGLLTRHSVEEERLSPELRELVTHVDVRGRVRDASPELLDAAFEEFRAFLEPLGSAGKMGGVLLQFPPWVTATDRAHAHENLAYIEYAAAALAPHRVLVEFRHPSWLTGRQHAQTMRFLADRGLSYVSVDAPQFADASTMPPVTAATSDWAYVRMHGRNRETYFARTGSAADRFDYLYTSEELAEWAPRVRDLAQQTNVTWVMFNNCKHDYAPRNARELASMLHVEPYGGSGAAGGQLDLGV